MTTVTMKQTITTQPIRREQPRSSLAMASDPGKALRLAPTFQPDVDLLISEGLMAFGVKGSGKTNLLALLAEQLGRFHLPQLLLDTEGEQQSLVTLLPHGVIATANRCPSGYDILHKGLQVIVDLHSWESDEAAALALCQLISELFLATNAIAPQDRYPCVIHLDEAAYWLPQNSVSYFSKDTRQAVADAFHKLASRGRKQGLTPLLYTQSISEVRKETIRQSGILVLMRQTLDIDVHRSCEYIYGVTAKTRAAIRAFPQGRAVVILPDGSQHRVQFNERQSEHTSHTPKTQAALAKFATQSIDLAALPMRDLTTPVHPDQTHKPRRQTTQPGKAPVRERVFALLEQDQMLTPRQIASLVGCSTRTASEYRRAYGAPPIPRTNKMEQCLRTLLTENPSYTLSQLQHRTHYSLGDVRRLLARIQAEHVSSEQEVVR